MRYSTCFALTMRSVTSSFLLAAATRRLATAGRKSTRLTFERLRLVELVHVARLCDGDVGADLKEVGAGGEVRDGA